MKDVNVFIPEPGNTKAILAVSSLARAMNEMNKVAILRCVWRQGQGNVVIGVLTPNLSTVDNVVSLPWGYCISCLTWFTELQFQLSLFFFLSFLSSQIRFISMCFLLLKMFESFSFHPSEISHCHGSQMSDSKKQQTS